MWVTFILYARGTPETANVHSETDQEVAAVVETRRPWPEKVLIDEPNLKMFQNIYNADVFYIYIRKES